MREKRRGIYAWVKHTESYLTKSFRNIHFVRYEDLKKDTFQEIKKIVNKLNVNVSDKVIKEAIKESSLENMKKNEALTKSDFYKLYRTDLKFVRKGKTQNFKMELSKEDD